MSHGRKKCCDWLTSYSHRVVYQLNATRLNTTLNLTSLGSLLNWFGIQAIRVYMKLECQTPGYHIVNWMYVIQWLF